MFEKIWRILTGLAVAVTILAGLVGGDWLPQRIRDMLGLPSVTLLSIIALFIISLIALCLYRVERIEKRFGELTGKIQRDFEQTSRSAYQNIVGRLVELERFAGKRPPRPQDQEIYTDIRLWEEIWSKLSWEDIRTLSDEERKRITEFIRTRSDEQKKKIKNECPNLWNLYLEKPF